MEERVSKYKKGDIVSDGAVVLKITKVTYSADVVTVDEKDDFWRQHKGAHFTYDSDELDECDLDVNGPLAILYGDEKNE